MNPQDLTWLIEKLAKYGFVGVVSGGIVFMLCRNFMGSYLNKKGGNLATKEDIAGLTKLVKDVEHGYNVLIEDQKAKQQLRMAAVDQRLQAHQDAFALWRKMTGSTKEEEGAAIMECQEFWDRNCLYLAPEVRQAFALAYRSFAQRRQMLDSGVEAKFISEAWRDVMAFPNVLFDAVKLPRFSEAEKKVVEDDSNQ